MERSTDSAVLIRINFPQAEVYAQDLNYCARQALSPPDKRRPIRSMDPRVNSEQWMPQPGEVEMIVSGSPW
jgi:hypothetical protein